MTAPNHGQQLDTPTASGRTLNLAKPRDHAVDSFDIATHLAKLCRHNGACRGYYSVAQHSILVADIALAATGSFETGMRALLHDAHEAYTGHIPRSTTFYLEGAGGSPSIRDMQADITNTINAWFGMPPITLDQVRAIEIADLTALATEYRDLMPKSSVPQHLPKPWKRAITPWPWQKAEEKFIEKYEDLEAMIGAPEHSGGVAA